MKRTNLILVTLFISTLCFGQADYHNDELLALVEPINISFFKNNNFKSLQISYYSIQPGDTTFEGNGSFYKLIDDSLLGMYWSQLIKSDSKAKNYFREDKFGFLYPKSSTDGKEYPSTYEIYDNGKVIMQKSQTGVRYFFYNDIGQLVKSASDTFNLAPNRPYSIIEYEYNKSLLIKKTRSVYDSGEIKPVTSDTILYSYSDKKLLIGYSFTKYSSSGFMGSFMIVRYSDGLIVDLIQTNRKELTRYKFEKKR